MQSDVEIAQAAQLLPITEVAAQVGISEDELEPYGRYKAKLTPPLWDRIKDQPDGRLVLVTAITPTPMGEGKTTTTVGLGQALARLGKRAMIALREPSLGPVFGVKGGAAGGGWSQVVPMEDINLHFTGDIHAVTSAHNLLAVLLDNHLHHGNDLGIDPRHVVWQRVMDLNDRALRQTVIGLGGKQNGVPREDGFMITAASEIMAILCLASDLADLKERLARVIVAYTRSGSRVTAGDLKAQGAMALLLKEALKPNLVQTLENTPALVHGGPFANIAHGANSLIATRYGLKLADYLVTEVGFGADLGAEKFVNIAARVGGLRPDVAVLVATVRALKLHGGKRKNELKIPDPAAVERGFANLEKHLENLDRYGLPVVVAVNRFPDDTQEEVDCLVELCRAAGAEVAVSETWARGGAGGEELARKVVRATVERPTRYEPLYPLDLPLKDKIERVCREVYGAADVQYSKEAERSIRVYTNQGLDRLPVCMAKTQYSFSDDPALVGRPSGFTITVKEATVSAGAGFVVVRTGDILTMPGLPAHPAAENMDIDISGQVRGLF